MSRELPARASLEHLRKQAKALLRDLQQRAPDAQLADAQHALAREYGFASWTRLKTHLAERDAAADPFAEFVAAVRADDVDGAASLLRRHHALAARLNAPVPGMPFGERPLAAVVQHQQRAMIDLFIRHGADPNGKSDWWAGGFGVLEICEPALAPFLIERGATVGVHAAARLGMRDALDALLAADPSLVHARGGDGQTPLHYAPDVEIARLLLDRGADPDARDVDHESTPAQWMVRGRQDVARFLVDRGARTDLLMAAALGDLARVRRQLDEDPASIAMRVDARWFPMRDPRAGGTIYIWTIGRHRTAHAAAREHGHEDVLRLLLDRSPDDVRLAEGVRSGDDATVASVLARRPTLVRELPPSEQRALVDAAEELDAAAVGRMLDAGWPVDARGREGGTALHFAAWLGDTALVRALLRRGAPLEVRDTSFDGTPLAWALHGSVNGWRREVGDFAGTVEALLAAGADPSVVHPTRGASTAVLAVLQRHVEQGTVRTER